MTEDAGALTAFDRVMLIIVAGTLAGTCLLISASEGTEPGQVPWRPGSILRIVTALMNLNHQYPTPRGVEVKWLVQGVGAAAALLAAVMGWFLGRGLRIADCELRIADSEKRQSFVRGFFSAMDLTTAAQAAFVLFAVWMMLSALWAPWPGAALGEGMRQAIVTVWAIALGRSLSRAAARRAAEILLAILAVTAALGVWYYFERNPGQRLKFPIGNPLFLCACLLPGFTLAGAMVISNFRFPISDWNSDNRKSEIGNRQSHQREMQWRAVRIAGAIISLLALSLAFVLSDSRGPVIALAIGVMVVVLLLVSWRWRIGIFAAGVVLSVAVWSLRLWPMSWLANRPDTLRVRLYAWDYALKLFLERPDIGKGQGGFMLLAHRFSRADAERDPMAFPRLLGHAHSEWLEILADLGAVGIGLIVTALGITFWAAVVAIRKLRIANCGLRNEELADQQSAIRNPKSAIPHWWLLVGLLAAFVAIIVEDSIDVALRMPGLPIIFYTVIGLLWAMSRQQQSKIPKRTDDSGLSSGDEPADQSAIRNSQSAIPTLVRFGGLAAGLVGSAIIFSIASRDWSGALADPRISTYAGKRQWEEAMQAASVAARGRLAIEGQLSAVYQLVQVAHDAAGWQLQQLREMLDPARQQGKQPAAVRRLAAEDAAAFEHYFEVCVNTGSQLLRVMPAYPNVAGWIADVWLYRQEMTELASSLGGFGLREPGVSCLDQARQWLAMAYLADRLNAELALRLLQLSGQQPLPQRLNLLRLPLRSGPIHPALEPALAALMQDRAFEPLMNQLLAEGQQIAASGGQAVAEAYVPETLRLAALASKLRGQFERAAALADGAARLSEQIRLRFPRAVFFARQDQAKYLLLADPGHAERAVEAAKMALSAWLGAASDAEPKELRKALSLYLLAAGDEDGAGQVIQSLLNRPASADVMRSNIGSGYAELCQVFMMLPPQIRPEKFDDWLKRALQLAPDYGMSRMMAARAALEMGRDAAAVEHLKALDEIMDDPQQMSALLQRLASEFPDAAGLREFAISRANPAASAPAETGHRPLLPHTSETQPQ